MTGDEVRTVFERLLPQDEIGRLCQLCGVIERQRKYARNLRYLHDRGFRIRWTTTACDR